LEKPFEELVAKELNVKRVEYRGKADELQVGLDFNLTPELVEEGFVREIVRQIQDLRKQAGCRFDEWVKVYYQTDTKTANLIKKYDPELKKETLSDLTPSQKMDKINQKTFKVGEGSVLIGLSGNDQDKNS